MERIIKIAFWGNPLKNWALRNPKKGIAAIVIYTTVTLVVCLSDEIAEVIADKEAKVAREHFRLIVTPEDKTG